MLPNNQGEHSRHGIRPEGDPHLSLPGIRDIFGLEASDDLGTLVSQPHYSASPKPSSLGLNATSTTHSALRSHLFVTEVSSPESPASSRMSTSTHDYQPLRHEVASGEYSSLSPAYQALGWAPYDAQTLAGSLPSVHSLPPISAALAHPGGRGRSLSEVANRGHSSQNDHRGRLHDRHPSLTVPSQGVQSGIVSLSATTAGPADTEAPHRRTALGDRGPVHPPSYNPGTPHLSASSRHYSPTHAPFYEPGRAMSPMPVPHPGTSATRHLQAGAGSWYRHRPDAHDRSSSRSNESTNSPLHHRQESLMRTTPHQSLSSPSSPRLYGRPVGRAHHAPQWTSSPSLQGHLPVSHAGTTGTTRRLHPSSSSSSLKGTQSSEETVTEDKSAGRYECEYCSKRFNRPSSLKIHVNKHTGAQPFQCPFPDCSRRFSVMSNMRRHARVHTNALVDTPTEGERPHQAGASGANPDTSSQDMPPSRGSGWRAGLTRGSISSRGRSSSFSGPGSPNDMEMEMAEERESSSAFSPSDPGRSAHHPITHIPPSGASSIPHVGSAHPSLP